MEIRNIVILYNADEVSREAIVDDLQEEGYMHNFMFANNLSRDVLDIYLMDVDEVWLFKDCSKLWQVEYFMEKGLSPWQML